VGLGKKERIGKERDKKNREKVKKEGKSGGGGQRKQRKREGDGFRGLEERRY